MEAIRLHPNPDTNNPYSVKLSTDIPIPRPRNPGEILVKVEATTIIRDSLTWPEIYDEEHKIVGWDFAGTVVTANDASDKPASFKVGDEVFGMVSALRAGTWAQYAIVLEEETCLKPKNITWAQAAAVPLSVLTAYQALFEKAGLAVPENLQSLKSRTTKEYLLVTGAVGGVGLYIIQLARLLDLYVVAATSSNERNKGFLEKLRADGVIEYRDLTKQGRRFQVIIDAVGGDTLKNCWSVVTETGNIISIDSASYNFVEKHRRTGLADGCDGVTALFFIVEPSNRHLIHLSAALEAGVLKPFVAAVLPLMDAAAAYEDSATTPLGRGKVVFKP